MEEKKNKQAEKDKEIYYSPTMVIHYEVCF